MNCSIISERFGDSFREYVVDAAVRPLFFHGDVLNVLAEIPDNSFDFVMTSPPYWNQRVYAENGVGGEKTYDEYVEILLKIFTEIHRTLKKSGSFWLNIGDVYLNKKLLGLPWRVALAMIDRQGWILRNDVVWNKVKGGMDATKDRLGNVHENVFHFVKTPQNYYYNVDAIRSKPRQAKIVNGALVSATGVSGVRYKRQLELSTALNEQEKADALKQLNIVLNDVKEGKISDFRMVIRGEQRTTHSDSEKISGRAKELKEKGFYFLKYNPKGCKPSDVWDILPEDTQKRKLHVAPYQLDLCRIPLLATCPQDGIAFDPFCGTGTTSLAALQLGIKSLGVDLSLNYLEHASQRCATLL
ncbi:MAG: site-specific DNA-methyltransferase [Thermoguttaceae bacterium]|nr:site-specific DNA-methyltransferase [Thermoguttaceae bacterium]